MSEKHEYAEVTADNDLDVIVAKTDVALFPTPGDTAPLRLVVGIGASAGGLDAFKTFFNAMRDDTGMAFVLVQHLAPHAESVLTTLIAGFTAMRVLTAGDGMQVEANTVYIIPPDAILTIAAGRLHVESPAPTPSRRISVTIFLTSLAIDQEQNAVGIILSGFGSDGVDGIAAIKEHGGLTLSQAEFDHHAKRGMPQSSTTTGCVDHVLPVEEMPAALLNYQHHRTIFDTFIDADGIRCVNLIVEPLPDPQQLGLLVLAFQDVAPAALPAPLPDSPHSAANHPSEAEFEKLLLLAQERLRAVSEELEAANKELQSSNQEYLAVNEELQSANEELETSKEELQSLNEELQATNAALHHRNDSLVRSSGDLNNLFDSTSIATLFLDSAMNIRRFTPQLLDIFNLREGDEGRPISDIVSRLTLSSLPQDVLHVLSTRKLVEREVMATSGVTYLMQIRPYRELNHAVNGAVVTFVDISERKLHEHARSRLAAIVESSQDGIISHDLGGIITSWNAGAELLFGFTAAEAIGREIENLLHDPHPEHWPNLASNAPEKRLVKRFETVLITKRGHPLDVSITISPVREGDGRIVGASVVARDISERKATDRKAELLLGELDHRVKNTLAVVSAVVSQTLSSGLTPEAFAVEVEGRIRAVAKAHSLLTHAGHGALSLREVINTELAPYDRNPGHIVVQGPDVDMTPKAGLALAMAIHELTSNAAKYGALSTQQGHLAVISSLASGPDGLTLCLDWTEANGPPVVLPTRRGFGTSLIERALAYELDAKVTRSFAAPGVVCQLLIPLTEEVGHVQPRTVT